MLFKIDSGADINIISERHWNRLKQDSDQGQSFIYDVVYSPDKKVTAFASSEPLSMIASFKAWTEVVGTVKPRCFTIFYVAKGGTSSLLSRDTAKKVKVLKLGLSVNAVTEEVKPLKPFPSVPGEVVEFDIDESVPPTQNAYYHVPAAFAQKARERLREMEEQEIIEKVTEAPEWISGMSAVPKGATDFRLVVNMRGPNKAIRRSYYRFPTIDEIRHKLHGSKYFSKIDITMAFFHLVIGEKSRKLTTFMTETGMYRFKRLVFGVSCAPEIFQRLMDTVIGGIPGTLAFLDDVCVHAEDLETLRVNTAAVIKRLKENNLTLNLDKCEFEKRTLKFLGFEISEAGLSIDQDKVRAVKNFREPKELTELKSFLGLATSVSAFIPDFATMTRDLWKVTAAEAFQWEQEQKEAFLKTKDAVAECTLTQGFFSDTDSTYLYTDASPYALGAALVQADNGGQARIICCASKTLTDTEKRYPQSQREALGIVWAVEHFYYYLMGRFFTIRTDAEGIAFIFRRASSDSRRMITRADGWALRLGGYNYAVEHIPGKTNIADALSRLHVGDDGPYTEAKHSSEVCVLVDNDDASARFEEDVLSEEEIRNQTEIDDDLQTVWSAVEGNDWDTVKRTVKDGKIYASVKEQLSTDRGVVTKTGAIVLPASLRSKALSIAHSGHPGTTAMKSILRARVWWPKMSTDVENFVGECESCTLTARRDPPVPMSRSKLPEGPWEDLAIDFSGPYARYGGIYVFVVVDYFSRFLSLSIVPTTSYEAVEKSFEDLFQRFGYPRTIKSDNGPPFNGAKYKQYCLNRGILALFATPLHPQQNGMAERYMQVVNKAMAIATSTNEDFKACLAKAVRAHNSSVNRTTNLIPEELVFGRKVRRNLPLFADSRVNVNDQSLRDRDDSEKAKAKWREDQKRNARATKIVPGDHVVILNTQPSKGETRFHKERYVVAMADRGDLTLISKDGKLVKRNTTHVKLMNKRARDTTVDPEDTTTNDEPQGQGQQTANEPQKQDQPMVSQRDPQPVRRSERQTKRPKHLKNYVCPITEQEK